MRTVVSLKKLINWKRPDAFFKKLTPGLISWVFQHCTGIYNVIVSFLTSVRMLFFSRAGGWTDFQMSPQYLWRWSKSWIIPTVLKNVYNQDIVQIYWKWEAKKTFIASEVNYTNINTLKKTVLYDLDPELE